MKNFGMKQKYFQYVKTNSKTNMMWPSQNILPYNVAVK